MFSCRYGGQDRLIRSRLRFPPNSLRFVVSKIGLDGGVFKPIYGISFFIQFMNFRYMQVMYQLLYVSMFCLLDNAFMSWLEQQEDAPCPWKKWFTSFLTFEDQQLEKKPNQGMLMIDV
ncbi:hypothetical protein MKX01_022645 [Papaver californicum]|nr:hypothetical protein MKX01_022645 [Papaver californicum]